MLSFLAACLICFYLQAALFFTAARAISLQAEFMEKAPLKSSALWGACALVLVVLEPVLRARLASLPRETVLNQPAAMSRPVDN